jgi:hypothetical protein
VHPLTTAILYRSVCSDMSTNFSGAAGTKEYEKVAAMYSSTDLSFLPTVSPQFIRDPQVRALESKLKVTVKLVTILVTQLYMIAHDT